MDHRLTHLSIKNLWTLKNHLSQMETHVEKWALTLHPEPILHLVQNIFIMDTDYVRHMLDRMFYYTSEEFFLYKITVDKRTIHHFSRQNELLTGT